MATIALKLLGENCENIKGSLQEMKNHSMNFKMERMAKLKQEIYIIFFIKMHKEKLFRPALRLARLIIDINLEKNISNIIFPILILESLQ